MKPAVTDLCLPFAARRARRPGLFRAGMARAGKTLAMVAGGVLVLAGIAIAPLPGPLGVPVSLAGLILILRNSYWAKRQFIRAQRARPKFVYPFRRLMRKKPEVAPVFWQQALRAEKVVLKRANRVLRRSRLSLRRRWKSAFAR